MRKFLTFLLFMVLMAPCALHADEVIVGTGTDVARDAPFNVYYSDSYNEIIYPASEIGMSGVINSISYYATVPGSKLTCSELRIYIGETSRSSFSNNKDWTPASDLTMVYQQNNIIVGVDDEPKWQTFNLDTPYLYEGNDNLVIVIAKRTPYYNSSMRWQYTNTPNTCMYRQSDWGGNAYLEHPGSNTGSICSYRSNVKLDITPMEIDCYKVKSVNFVAATPRTITIGWEPYPGQSSWDVYVSLDGNAPDANTTPTATSVTETTYTFTGLTPNSTYTFYVRGNCGESVGSWKSLSCRTDPDFGGSGTEEDPYKIYSYSDLKMLADNMKLGFVTKGKYFVQMDDIEGVNFCIGDGAVHPFRGTYDGDGHSVDVDLYGNYNQGLFQTLGHGAVVRNVTVTGKVQTRNWQAGGIVAYIDVSANTVEQDHIYIENCVNRAKVWSDGNNVGGIISDFNGNDGCYLFITNCVNHGEVSALTTTATGYVGGITGRLQKNAVVNNCVNYGEINAYGYSGGISAYPRTNVIIANCVNKGDVNGVTERIGGISGYSSGASILNCYNLGTVKGDYDLGGIIGRLKGESEGQGIMQNVYNAGQVISSSGNTDKTGAIIGRNEGGYSTVTYAYYLDSVYSQAYGTAADAAIISNISSFTQDAESQTNFILANEVNGTTDLLSALNAYNVEGRNEWFADIYGNNSYYPTFVVGNPPGIEFVPNPFAMGARPIGAVMHPEAIAVTNTGSTTIEVTNLELSSSSFFVLDENSDNPELPVVLEAGQSVDLYVTTRPDATPEAGEISTSVGAIWNKQNRLASIGDITATAYMPIEGDVVETAQVVNAFPFNATSNTSVVYDNYDLPGNGPDANDVVYEINITEDVLLNASVNGANGKIAVYKEDLNGDLYPNKDNNYKGTVINDEASLDYFFFNQAQMVTNPGQGYEGADASVTESAYGLNINKDWYYVADDFSSEKDFSINEMEFYAYQTGSSLSSTMTALYVQIYNGNPMEGADVIWGNMTDNIMTYSQWTNIYRVANHEMTGNTRPIMRVVASNLDIELPAGTYWVAVAMSGSLSSGPFAIPVTLRGVSETGNGITYANGGWSEWTDEGHKKGLAMIIREGYSNRSYEPVRNQDTYKGEPSVLVDMAAQKSNTNRAGQVNVGGDEPIQNLTMTPGKYYVVASSSSGEFEVEIDTEVIPLPEAPILVSPDNYATEVSTPLTLCWTLGQYTTEYQILFGGSYPPTEVLQDWTSELASSYTVTNLYNNTNYFWKVNERNASGVTEGDIWSFTTTFNKPHELDAVATNLYPGDDVVLTWSSAENRTHRGYNVYQDGVKINNKTITETTYTVSGLEYNMEGYEFRVSAVYDEGESAPSPAIKVYMTGNGTVEGYTYEQDGVTPIPGVSVKFAGLDEFNTPKTVTFISDENGYYTGEMLAGSYSATTKADNYQDATATDIVINYNETTSNVNFNIYEEYVHVAEVKAEEVDDSNVNVYWSWNKMLPNVVDFETGDFSQAEFNNTVSDYPWAIVEGGYESNYAIKSTCEGVDDAISAIEVTVEVPADGMMGFNYRISSEAMYDNGKFYIDETVMATMTGESEWLYKQVPVTAGTHTYRWEYTKDIMWEDGEDAMFVDNISFYFEPEPFAGGWLHYDDGTYATTIGMGEVAPVYWAISFPASSEYAGYTIDKLSVFDAPDSGVTGSATASLHVYLGGDTAPSTLMTSKDVTFTGSGEFIEVTLDTPVAIDGSQPFWILGYCEQLAFPAAGSAHNGDSNSDWLSLDGTTWEHASDYQLSASWMLRANLTNAKGQTMVLTTASKALKFKGGASTGTLVAAEVSQPIFVGVPKLDKAVNSDQTRALNSYKVYRVNSFTGEYTAETVELLASELSDTTYMDASWATAEPGVYRWGVAAVYEGNRTSVNNAKSFVPGPGFVACPTETLPYDGDVKIGGFDPSMLRSDMAYANNVFPSAMAGGYVQFNLNNPLGAVAINDVIVNRAGEYYDGVFYGYDSNNNYYKINPMTGAVMSQNAVSQVMTEMAYDYSTNTMYGINEGILYTIDIETGSATVVGDLGQIIMAFGIDLTGAAYGIALGSGDFYYIDLQAVTATFVGATGVGCNYLQCAGFNHNDGTFYWFQCYDSNNMGLYTVDVTTGAATLLADNIGEVTSWFVPFELDGEEIWITYPFQDANESPIVWSEPIDKDMFTTVNVKAATNSGDAPTGAVVEFINLIEKGNDYVVTLDETGLYSWDNFRKGTYLLTISLPGYVSSAAAVTMEIMDATSVECTLDEIAAAVGSLYVSPTGWAMWERTTGAVGDEFEYTFETDTEGWTTIDADGDGKNWVHSSGFYNEYEIVEGESHSGSGHVGSASYHFALGALTPDNYLVTPQRYSIGANSVLTFWAAAQDEDFPSEHFGIAISAVSNNNADDFTTVWEETMIGKKASKEGERGYGKWYEYNVDLSEYAGQKVYIAFRHFNSFDQFLLRLDDVRLINSSKAPTALTSYTVMLNGETVGETTVPYYQHDNLIVGEQYTTTVVANYTTGTSEPMSYTWDYMDCSNFDGATEFTAEYADGKAVLNWTLSGGQTPPTPPIETMTWDFEDGLAGWTIIDADGDGYEWFYDNSPAINSLSGEGSVYSESYDLDYQIPLTPDNYLITPQKIAVGAGTEFSFWACAQDELYPSEHFGVAVSTTGNTSASDFTTISEWTMTAKAGKGTKDRARGTRTPGEWYEYSVDLSDYAGQEVWIAIRHFNCTDMFYLVIDDVEIGTSKETREGTWAYYDDGINLDGIGMQSGGSFSWAIKLRSADIANLGSLTKVSIYDRVATSGTFDICLGGDNEPGASVLNQAYTLTAANDFVEFSLTESVDPAGQNVWIVFNTDDAANFPASCSANTGDADGRWIYLEGSGWFDVLTGAGIEATWMIRGYFGEDGNMEETDANIIGVMVYRDGELLTPEPLTTNTFTEELAEIGEYEYCIRVVHDGAIDTAYYAMSCPQCETVVAAMPCDAPTNLYAEQAEQDGKSGVSLVWPYSSPVSEWLYYDDGVNLDGIGGPQSFYWGIMFPAENIAAYQGASFTKVSLFDFAASSGDINIYYGGTSSPGDLIHTQPYSMTGTKQFVEFDLTAALPIDPTMNVWITFSTNEGTNYPAAISANTGDANGRWISTDGSEWFDLLTGAGIDGTWMVRAYVENAKGELSSLEPITDYEYTVSEGEIKAIGEARNGRALDHYNVYRSTTADNFEVIAETTEGNYFDELTESGTYYYQVTAVYVDGDEECESDPANSYSEPSQNYVSVEFVSIDENGVNGMMIYPNPTKGDLNITAENMTRITITNALGQVMYDQEVDADNEIINMAQFEAGVYMLRIVTENGVAVERVTVVR